MKCNQIKVALVTPVKETIRFFDGDVLQFAEEKNITFGDVVDELVLRLGSDNVYVRIILFTLLSVGKVCMGLRDYDIRFELMSDFNPRESSNLTKLVEEIIQLSKFYTKTEQLPSNITQKFCFSYIKKTTR